MLKFRAIESQGREVARYTVRRARVLIGYVYCHRMEVTERRYEGDGRTMASVMVFTSIQDRWGAESLKGIRDSGYETRQDAARALTINL